MECLFCETNRDSEKINRENKYICSSCVQILLNMSQQKLQAANALAIEKKHKNKMRALKSFIARK